MNTIEGVIISLIFIIVLLIIKNLTLIFSLWTNKSIKICFYFYFVGLNISVLILTLPFFFYKFTGKKLRNMNCIQILICFIFGNFSIIGFITLSVNISNYRKYFKQCPFTLNKLNYNIRLQKRCELYNINNYSRYTYQYICSYDASKDFKYNLKKERKNDVIICIPFKTLIDNNDIVSNFYNEYKYSEKYYCSRTKRTPDDYYKFINPKNCNDKSNYIRTVIFFVISLFSFLIFENSIIFIYSDASYNYIKDQSNSERNVSNGRINQNIENNENNIPNENNNRIVRQNSNNRRIIGLHDLIISNFIEGIIVIIIIIMMYKKLEILLLKIKKNILLM